MINIQGFNLVTYVQKKGGNILVVLKTFLQYLQVLEYQLQNKKKLYLPNMLKQLP